MMATARKSVLMLGASYGSLLATKLALAGHDTTMVCLPVEVEAFNRDGAIVRIPVKGQNGLVTLNSKSLSGRVRAAGPGDVDPTKFDLVGLAMQEPQYRSPGVRELMVRVAAARVPCMSIMNMPPLAYLKRLSGLDHQALRDCFADATVWDGFDPSKVTLCSPDPQAFRPPEEPVNVLQVSLPTNFKAARFADDADTAILNQFEADIQAARLEIGGQKVEIPVKLKTHDSLYVPLAKWAMLLTGNYRCIGRDGMRSIREAVHTDLAASREVYEWVNALCVEIGANPADLVPFDKYAAAAEGLAKPSSAARALAAGAQNIERVDKLVAGIARQKGRSNPSVTASVEHVEAWLAKNRAAAAKG